MRKTADSPVIGEQEMEETVKSLISQRLLDDAGRRVLAGMGNDESLIEAGLLDSLGLVQMVSFLEQEFEVIFDPMDIAIENLESVERIVALVQSRMQQ